MPQSDNEPNQMAFAFGWMGRVTTVILEMVLPGLGGQWLDSREGTNYWVIIGFGLGFALGIFHLLQMVKHHTSGSSSQNNRPSKEDP